MSIQIQTYCAYAWLIVFMLFEFAAMISGIAYIPLAADCLGGVDQLTMPMWLFVNGIFGVLIALGIVVFYAAKICECHSEGSNDCCSTMPRQIKSACFWMSIFLPLLFRLVWLILGIVLVAGAAKTCSYRSGMTVAIISHIFITIFSMIAMVKLACSPALNSD